MKLFSHQTIPASSVRLLAFLIVPFSVLNAGTYTVQPSNSGSDIVTLVIDNDEIDTSNAAVFNSTTATLSVSSGTTGLNFGSSQQIQPSQALRLQDTFILGPGTTVNLEANTATPSSMYNIQEAIQLSPTATLNVYTSATTSINLSGMLSGTTSSIFNLEAAQSSSYTGPGATVTLLGSGSQFLGTTHVSLGTLSVNNNLGGSVVLSGTGNLMVTGPFSATSLNTGSSQNTTTFSAGLNNNAPQTLSATLSGAGSIIKQGNGTLTLGQASSPSYSGNIQVQAGTLGISPGCQVGNPNTGVGTVTIGTGSSLTVLRMTSQQGISLGTLGLAGTATITVPFDTVNQAVNVPTVTTHVLNINSGNALVLQIDQSETSMPTPVLSVGTMNINATPNFTVNIIGSANLTSAAVYPLISGNGSNPVTINNNMNEQTITLANLGNYFSLPVTYSATLAPNTQGNVLELTLTKQSLSSLLAGQASSTLIGFATQLQDGQGSGANSNLQGLGSALDNAASVSDLATTISNLTPTGHQQRQTAFGVSTQQMSGQLRGINTLFCIKNMGQRLMEAQGASYQSKQRMSKGFQQQQLAAKTMEGHFSKYLRDDRSFAKEPRFWEVAGLALSLEPSYSHTVTAGTSDDPGVTASLWGASFGGSKAINEKLIVGTLLWHNKTAYSMNPNTLNKTSVGTIQTNNVGIFGSYQGTDHPFYLSTFLSLGHNLLSSTRTWLQPVTVEYITSNLASEGNYVAYCP